MLDFDLCTVPLFYAITLFRNQAELEALRHLELSIVNETNRVKLGEFLTGKERRDYQPEIDEAEERKIELEEKYEARRADLPGDLRKLTGGYEMRTYWFEIFECIRKILLVGLPVFFEPESVEQLTVGLIICFMVFGAYMMWAPFIDDGDDFLSQICQLQIFISLLSTIVLKANPDSQFMSIFLVVMLATPPILAFVFESGVLEELAKVLALCPGLSLCVNRRLRILLGVKAAQQEEDDEVSVQVIIDTDAALDAPDALDANATGTQLERSPSVDSSVDVDDLLNDIDVPRGLLLVFREHDRNNNGVLEYRELRSALKALCVNVSYTEAAEYIERYDDHTDEQMDFSEFIKLVHDLNSGYLRFSRTAAIVKGEGDPRMAAGDWLENQMPPVESPRKPKKSEEEKKTAAEARLAAAAEKRAKAEEAKAARLAEKAAAKRAEKQAEKAEKAAKVAERAERARVAAEKKADEAARREAEIKATPAKAQDVEESTTRSSDAYDSILPDVTTPTKTIASAATLPLNILGMSRSASVLSSFIPGAGDEPPDFASPRQTREENNLRI